MQNKLTSKFCQCVITVGLLVTPVCCWAADWVIKQDVNLSANVSLSQGSNGAWQGLNVIMLASGDNLKAIFVSNAPFYQAQPAQLTLLTNTNLTLSQAGSGTGNVQAANALKAGKLENIVQRITGVAHARLQQTSTGTDNVQALNIAIIDKVQLIAQDVWASTVTLNNRGAADNNTQAINYIYAQGNIPVSNSLLLLQRAIVPTLNVNTDGSFDSLNRYGQGVNLIVHPDPASIQRRISQTATISTVNVNGTGVAPVMAIINRAVTP